MTRKELLGILYDLERNASDERLKQILDMFWEDAAGRFDHLELFSHTRNLIIRQTENPAVRHQSHLCAQRYLANLTDADRQKHREDIINLYADEVTYYAICNSQAACIQYADLVLESENVPGDIYCSVLGVAIDVLLKLKMYDAAAGYVKKLALFVETHTLNESRAYMMLANLMYAYAFLQDRENFEKYRQEMKERRNEDLEAWLIYYCDVYALSGMALLGGYEDEFQSELDRLLLHRNENPDGHSLFYQIDQAFLLTPILKKSMETAGAEWCVQCMKQLIKSSTTLTEKLDYYIWFFEETGSAPEKYPDLWRGYFQTLRAAFREKHEMAMQEVDDKLLRHDLAEMYRQQATTDSLTGVENRFAYETVMERYRSEEKLPDDFVIIMADMNNLKRTNDTQGHWAGDDLLCRAADCLKKAYLHIGQIYRVGGDEFVVLGRADRKALERADERLQTEIAAQSVNRPAPVEMSVGRACAWENPGLLFRALYTQAEQRMYEEKRRYYSLAGHERRHA